MRTKMNLTIPVLRFSAVHSPPARWTRHQQVATTTTAAGVAAAVPRFTDPGSSMRNIGAARWWGTMLQVAVSGAGEAAD